MGDFAGHPFRGNQYTTLGAVVESGARGAVGPLSVRVYRVGALKDSGRGVFFADSREGAEPYAPGHPGHKVEEHDIDVKNAYVTESQHSLFGELFPGKRYNDAVYTPARKVGRG